MGNVADFKADFSIRIDSQQRNPFADGFSLFAIPWASSMLSDLGGHLALPKVSFIYVEVDPFENLGGADVPHVDIDSNDLRSTANVTVPWLTNTIMNGGSVDDSIKYDSRARNLSDVLMDAIGNSSNSISLHYPPPSA
ncbi:lectin 7-like [Eucalyptus grandis]|uniref:lectin 7-like n=1 Tax=Eucalyptus grandis TaxID=71139 RepID=UPI00192EE6DF|nr:lectin 7-like [Eucalyptus grandis]